MAAAEDRLHRRNSGGAQEEESRSRPCSRTGSRTRNRSGSPNFSGKWRLSQSDNFDPFLVDCSVGFLTRQAAKIVSSEHHIAQEEDVMRVELVAPGGRGKLQEYEVGGGFREVEINGEESEVETAWEGDTIRERHRTRSFEYEMVRELEDEDTMVLHLESDKGTKAKRVYKRVE